MKDQWYDTLNTKQRKIIDLRAIGMRHAVSFGFFHYNRAAPPLERQQHKEWLVLIFVIEGSQHYRINGEDRVVRGGQWLSVPPGTSYGTGEWPEQRGKTAWVILSEPFTSDEARLGLSAAGANEVIRRLLSSDPLVLNPCPRDLGERIEELFAGAPVDDACLGKEFVRVCLARILLGAAMTLEQDQSGEAVAGAVREVVKLIEQRPHQLPELADLIAATRLPSARFYRDFKRITGSTPGDFITRNRLEKAAHWLIESDRRSVTDIAHDLGFSTSQYFATTFRRHFGMTPSQWRERGLAGGDREADT